jgi:hypothetical protein
MLTPVAEGLHEVTRPLSVITLAIGTRMSVLRGADGGLHLLSPVDVTPEEKSAIDALGPVRSIIVPNRMHTLFWRKAHAAWPDAVLHGPNAMRARHTDVRWAETAAPADEALDAAFFEGAPQLDETVLFHRPSGSVVVTDMAFHFTESPGWWTGAYLRSQGVMGRVGQTLLTRSAIKDRAAARRSADQILAWGGSRVVVAHGSPFDGDARAALADAFAWIG